MATATCKPPMKATSNGAWQGDDPLHFALPLLIVQICMILILTRFLAFLLRPLRQPRVIAEIIGGILLGPSALGRNSKFLSTVFPKQSLTVLDTLANLGLLFFLFLVGIELDLASLRRTGKKALAISAAGIALPFAIGIGTSFAFLATVSKNTDKAPFLVFMGVALSITAFPVLARILAELRLLTTDIGRTAMSAAAVDDVTAWTLLALAIALSGTRSPLVTVWVLLCGVAFIIGVALIVRPVLARMARCCPEGEPVKEVYICFTLAIVLAAGFVTDVIGIHALFGAFVVGIVVPKEGPFARTLIDKVEDFISGLFLPLYFVSSGLKTNVATIQGAKSWGLLALVIINACIGKIGGVYSVARLVKIPVREAFTLGFLMNTKGLVELIVLNIGKDRKVLNDESFAIMVLMALFTTFITTPIVMAIYKPARPVVPYKHRTIAQPTFDPAGELRVLACFHSSRNIPTILNLIESSRGTRHRRMTLYTMHLMEYSERTSAILMVQRARRNGFPFSSKSNRSSSSEIEVTFEAYQQLTDVSVRPMTAISGSDTIHDDIISSAMGKRASLIILPFHKVLQLDGSLESIGHEYNLVNKRVLEQAPCSVAVLIDRGLGGPAHVPSNEIICSVTMLFFGGADDREALAYALRMAEHPGIDVKVTRFLQTIENDNEQEADDKAIEVFLNKVCSAGDKSVQFEEKVASTREEVAATIKEMTRRNLFIVGRSPPTASLLEKTDCPELGPVGSFLASPEFSKTASVVVIQCYNPKPYPSNAQVQNAQVEETPVP